MPRPVIRRRYHTPAGTVEVYAEADPPALRLDAYPAGFNPATRRLHGADARAVALAVAAGHMPAWGLADWLEERGLPAVGGLLRQVGTGD